MARSQHIGIVGAGLVGSLMAIYLARRRYRVSVFERRPDPRHHLMDGGRSINLALSARGIRALNGVGLAEVVKQSAVPMHGRMMHDLSGSLTFQPYGEAGQYINSISRAGLNKLLISEAELQGVSFHFDQRVKSVDLDATAIHFDDEGNRLFDIIIGADGNFSAVRGAMQFSDRFDFSQHYIEHGYQEFDLPPGPNGRFMMERNALHIWPRESFMFIALPNPNGSFTGTLFFPFEGNPSFASLHKEKTFLTFFQRTFPDVVELMPSLREDYHHHPPSSLITVKCFPWVVRHTLLVGDAAHGILPFYGQGMNAGFEDCRVLDALLEEYHDDWDVVLPIFQAERRPNTDAIARLAMDNFIEMRDLVADEDFLLRKKIEARIHELFPTQWIPLYAMVTFSDEMGYAEALEIGEKQRKIMDEVMALPDIATTWMTLDFQQLVRRLWEA